MKLNKLAHLVILLLFVLACGSTPQPAPGWDVNAIHTSAASTLIASINLTALANIPTNSPGPTATATITASPSPTPDVRLIDIDPRKLLLQKGDLPTEGRYYLPGETWISPLRNYEIISAWTVEEGQAYLKETGRIDGWLVYYKRGVSGVVMPEQVYDNVVIYSSIQGANLLVSKYGDRRITEENYTEIDVQQIGDVTRAFMKRETNSGGETRMWILLAFSYRNVSHSVNIYGWEKEISLDFAVSGMCQRFETRNLRI
jgi:hypothetical protein